MKVAFLSNYMCIHQVPFCEAMYQVLGDDFCFIATEEIAKERLSQGYSDLNHAYPFIIRPYEGKQEQQKAQSATDEADVVVIGSAPLEYIQNRLKNKKLTFLYSERLYKTGYQAWKLPVRLWRFWKKFGRHKSLYLLCASAFTAADFAKTGTFLGKAYKWGYFPPTYHYEDIDTIIESKRPNSILWVARFLDLKHPEYVIEVARRLREDNYEFQIQMLGSGERWDAIKQMIRDQNLQDCVQLVGAVPAEQVRDYMDAASIFLFTSDRNEGWGAVLNESMNSGCAVVASDAIGSVPFLLQDGENGLCYQSGNVDDLYDKVKTLLEQPQLCRRLGEKAYETVTALWCAEVAVKRLLEFAESLMDDPKQPVQYESGPCSKAEIIKDNWHTKCR